MNDLNRCFFRRGVFSRRTFFKKRIEFGKTRGKQRHDIACKGKAQNVNQQENNVRYVSVNEIAQKGKGAGEIGGNVEKVAHLLGDGIKIYPIEMVAKKRQRNEYNKYRQSF